MEMRTMNMNSGYTSQGVFVPGPPAGTGMGFASQQMTQQEYQQYAQSLGFKSGEEVPISATPIIEMERYKRMLEINHKMQHTYAEMEANKQHDFEEQADKERGKAAKWRGRKMNFLVNKHERKATKLAMKAHEHHMAADGYSAVAKRYEDERRQFTPPKSAEEIAEEKREKEAKEKKKDDKKDKAKEAGPSSAKPKEAGPSAAKSPVKEEKSAAKEVKPVTDNKVTDKTERDAQPGPSQTAPPRTDETKPSFDATEEEKRRWAEIQAEEQEELDEELDEEIEEEEQIHALSMLTSQTVIKDPPHPFHHPDAPHNLRKSAPNVPVGPNRPKQVAHKPTKRVVHGPIDDDDDDDTDSDDDDEYEYQQQKKHFWNRIIPVQPSYTQDVSTAAIRYGNERMARGNLNRSWAGTTGIRASGTGGNIRTSGTGGR